MFPVFTELQKTEQLEKNQNTQTEKTTKDKFLNSVAFCLFH